MRRLSTVLAIVAGVSLLALFVHLGLWQHGKAEIRAAELARHTERGAARTQILQADVSGSEALVDLRVAARGHYVAEQQIFLDNRQEAGVAGVQVLTPLRLDGSDVHVWVNRGWTPWVNGRQTLPQISTPPGAMQIEGRVAIPSRKAFLGMPQRDEAQGRLIMRLDVAAQASRTGLKFLPVLLLQESAEPPDALVRHWPPPEDRVAMHRGYAFQWFALASALALYGVYLIVRALRRRRHGGTSR